MSEVDTSAEAIAAIMEGVTPGPWVVDPSFQSHSYVRGGNDVLLASCSWRNGSDHVPALANARFIAAASGLIPALAAERDALRADVELLRAWISEFAAADFSHLPLPPKGHPEDDVEPVTDAQTVWNWQADAADLLK